MAKTSQVKILPVKRCYSHIGGQLGSLLAEHFIAHKWIEQVEDNERLYFITPKGKKAFKEIGVDISLIAEEVLD